MNWDMALGRFAFPHAPGNTLSCPCVALGLWFDPLLSLAALSPVVFRAKVLEIPLCLSPLLVALSIAEYLGETTRPSSEKPSQRTYLRRHARGGSCEVVKAGRNLSGVGETGLRNCGTVNFPAASPHVYLQFVSPRFFCRSSSRRYGCFHRRHNRSPNPRASEFLTPSSLRGYHSLFVFLPSHSCIAMMAHQPSTRPLANLFSRRKCRLNSCAVCTADVVCLYCWFYALF